MNKQDIEQLKRIRNKAPEGATHFDQAMYYKYEDGDWFDWVDEWDDCNGSSLFSLCYLRSLSDINTIIEQAERIAALDNFNQELRQRNIGFSSTIKDLRERIAELEEVLKDARGVCHKAGLELMRDDIDEVLKGGDV